MAAIRFHKREKKSLDAKLIFSYECVGDEAVIR